ncbi:MAG: SpoIIE family protein phosphatase, partial [Chitinivibrionia bacterium]|nr:SpoIIE family protein phosphatase [Chitinivibrionia bacterium]
MKPTLEQYASFFQHSDAAVVDDVRDFASWYVGRGTAEFDPRRISDVDYRTYLLHLGTDGMSRGEMHQKAESLQRFFAWIHDEGLIGADDFKRLQVSPLILHPSKMKFRKTNDGDTHESKELYRLRTLYHISEILNQSTDLKGAIDSTLKGLLEVLGLRTGWVSLWKETAGFIGVEARDNPHDFCLVSSCNLPKGLEQDDRRILRRPPDCYCQRLLREGRLSHAVNVVECDRLHEAEREAGGSEGFLYHATVPLITKDASHGNLNIATKDWELFSGSDLRLLSIVGQQIASAIERGKLFEQTKRQQQRIERELSIAHSVQASFIPKQLPDVSGFSLAAEWRSAREVSGDFYDVFPLDGDRVAFTVADVSGKGVPAALYMATVRALLRECGGGCATPGDALRELNKKLLAYSSSDMFVTMFCGILEPGSSTIVYANGGHEPPLLKRASGALETLPSTGPLLGVSGQEPFENASVTLAPGDVLFIYTDGAVDARDETGREYGLNRLKKCVETFPASA